MTISDTTETLGATSRRRRVAVAALRAALGLVAVVAAAIGVGFAVLAVIGPSVWVFSPDGSGAGVFLTLPLPLRIVHALAAVLASLTITVCALLLSDLAKHTRTGVRFVPTLSRTTSALGITLVVGPWLAQIAANTARWSIVIEADGSAPTIGWAPFLQALQPDWALLGTGLVVCALALCIRAGERLQRDTEGLV